jgi:hypothetical protein
VPTAKLEPNELELIDRLVRHDRTAVSSALLAIAGIGAGRAVRGAVLTRIAGACGGRDQLGASRADRAARQAGT